MNRIDELIHKPDASLGENIDWESLQGEVRARKYIPVGGLNTSLSRKKTYKNPGVEIIKFQLLILQTFLRSCVVGGSIQSVLSEKTGYQQQVQHGANFPLDLGNEILQIGTLVKNTLSKIPEDANLFEKIGHHYESSKELASYITLQVQEILSQVSNAKTNISQAPVETIHAAIGVAAMYFVLSEIVGILRLGDADTLMDRVRKRCYRTITRKNTDIEEEIISTFKNPEMPQHEKLKIFEDLLEKHPIGN